MLKTKEITARRYVATVSPSWGGADNDMTGLK